MISSPSSSFPFENSYIFVNSLESDLISLFPLFLVSVGGSIISPREPLLCEFWNVVVNNEYELHGVFTVQPV